MKINKKVVLNKNVGVIFFKFNVFQNKSVGWIFFVDTRSRLLQWFACLHISLGIIFSRIQKKLEGFLPYPLINLQGRRKIQ